MTDYSRYINVNEIYLFNIGEAQQAYAIFGCHFIEELKQHRFMVWGAVGTVCQRCGGF